MPRASRSKSKRASQSPPPKGARKGRKQNAINSDSDSDLKCQQLEEDQPTSSPKRLSSRLAKKRSKPDFKLPSRDVIWKDIPSIKSPEKLSRITPRKSVSNFTKIYNSYNFDDYEDTGDSGDEDSVSDSSSSSDKDKETPGRVKNYHKRIRLASSSSEEAESVLSPSSQCQPDYPPDTEKSEKDSGKSEDLSSQLRGTVGNVSDGILTETDSQAEVPCPSLEDSDNTDDSEEIVTPTKKRNSSIRRSLLDSSDESDSGSEDDKSTDRLQRSANLKQKQKSLFTNFKDAIAK